MSPWDRLQLEASQNTANTCQEELGVYLLHPHSLNFTTLPSLSLSLCLQLQRGRKNMPTWDLGYKPALRCHDWIWFKGGYLLAVISSRWWRIRNHAIVYKVLNPAIENFCSAQLSSHGGCQMKQVSVGPNKFFSLTPIDDVTCANELRSKPACYIHGPTHACNLFQARTRNSALKRGRWWCWASVLEY